MKDNSLPNLKRFLRAHAHVVRSLEALGIEDIGNLVLLHVSLTNLDTYTYKQYEAQTSSNTIPTFESLIDFITEKVRVSEMSNEITKEVRDDSRHVISPQNKSKKKATCATISKGVTEKAKDSPSKPNEHISTPIKCWNCEGPHVYSKCPKPRKKFCYRCGAKGEVTTSCSQCKDLNSKVRSSVGSP